MDVLKTCTKCGESKALEAFSAHKLGKGGKRPYCRACAAAAHQKTLREHPERIYAARLKWKTEHREERLRDKRAWLAKNKAKNKEARHRWYKNNPDVAAADRAKRRMLVKQGAELFKPLEIFERDGWVCHLCGEPTEQSTGRGARFASLDHIIPLSLGGTHTRDNVACAHVACNSAKRNRPWTDALRSTRLAAQGAA